jgi:hypothetical protein
MEGVWASVCLPRVWAGGVGPLLSTLAFVAAATPLCRNNATLLKQRHFAETTLERRDLGAGAVVSARRSGFDVAWLTAGSRQLIGANQSKG